MALESLRQPVNPTLAGSSTPEWWTTIHEAFDRVAARHADSPALECGGRVHCYAEIAAASRRLAARLAEIGVGVGDVVGVCVERSPEYVVAVLAILRCGAAYAPLPLDYPLPRLQGMVEDAGIRVVVIRGASHSIASGLTHRGEMLVVVPVDPESAWATDGPFLVPPTTGRDVGPDHPAYVMFTSGSTGRPIGVVIPHRAVSGLVIGQRYAAFGPDLRTLLLAPTAFDASTFEIWAPLLHGGTLVVYPDADFDPARLAEVVRDGRVNCLWLTAGLFNLVVDVMPSALAGVGHVITGGDVLSVPHVRRAFAELPGIRITNGYGPTETTTFACTHAIDANDPFPYGAIPIGRPLAHTACLIVDEAGRPVEDGEEGELWIGGSGVALRLLSDDAARFASVAVSDGATQRFYRSGDRCRRLPDGTHLFLGRIDQQVKIRGHRVEPAEIEAALAAHDLVRDAVVLPFSRDDDTALAAFVVRKDGDVRPLTDLQAWLADRLPAVMIPARLIGLSAFPLTPNGKVDRGQLLGQLAPRRRDGSRGDAPRPGTEATLAAAWWKLLGGEEPSRIDDFFAAGGNSLLAMRLVAAIDRDLGKHVAVRTIFETPVLADLAAAVDAAATRSDAAADTTIGAEACTPFELPALPAQRGMWFLQERLADAATYNQPFAFIPDAPVDWERFRAALALAMDRQPALRTALVTSPDGPLQRVFSSAAVALPWSIDPEIGPDGLGAALSRIAREPFDLGKAPLWRAVLFPHAAAHGVILLVFHHAIIDLWSMTTLLDELAAAGRGEPRSLPAPVCTLPPPGPARRDELRRHWGALLADAPDAIVPPGRSAVDAAGTAGRVLRRRLVDVGHDVRRVASACRATTAQVLVAAFHAWLHRVTGSDDVVVAMPQSLRAHSAAMESIGCMLNTLPLRIRWTSDDRPAEPNSLRLEDLVRRVRSAMLDAADHADLPYDEIVAAARPAGGRGTSLADVLVVVTEGSPLVGRFAGATLHPLACDTATAKFAFTCFLAVDGDGIDVAIEYASAAYDETVIAAHADSLGCFLRAACLDRSAQIAALPLGPGHPRSLPNADREVPAAWRGPAHACVAEAARCAPGETAVIAGARSLSWAELDAASRALARRLADLGAGPGRRVGICLPRTPASCVGILAVLRTGAAYVPLDPALPVERLARIARIAELRHVVVVDDTVSVTDAICRAGAILESVPVAGHPPAADFADVAVAASTPAYVLFTSGSSGEPKGVEMPHGALAALVAWQARSTPRSPGGRTLHYASTGFDVSFQELFAAWSTRSAVVIADEETRLDPRRLADTVSKEDIDRMFLPTAMLDAFADAVLASGARLAALRDVIVAGERLKITPSVRRFFARLPACSLWNHYGPTETHVVTAHRLEGHPESWPDFPPIGLPIDGARIDVESPGGDLLPPGCVGELVIGGSCIALGYVGRPDLTAERFVADPSSASPTGRRYRTGDLGWRRPDGVIEYVGRIDDQVKVRGHRVEPREVEAALVSLSGVREAAVVLHPSAAADESPGLVAFVTVADGFAGPEAARAALRVVLPAPMIPEMIVPLDALPRNANGKIDRRRLLSMSLPRRAAGAEVRRIEEPRGPVETAIADAWKALLGIAAVDRRDDFFALGGHSLTAMRLVARLAESGGWRVPVRAVFDRPVLADLAASISAAGPPTPVGETIAVGPTVLPALPAQRGMWFLHEILPDPATYNEPMALRPISAVDWDLVRERIRAAMERHPALRASLAVEGDGLVQRFAAANELPLPWREAPEVDAAGLAVALAAAAREPFDLGVAPLWRATLFPMAAPHGVLLIVFHHAIIDDWSRRALLDGLSTARAEPSPSNLVPMPAIIPRDEGKLREHWAECLADAPRAIPLPEAKPAPARPTGRGATVEFTVSPEVADAWRRIARRERATLFQAMLGACHAWLSRTCGTDDAVVLTPVAWREAAAAQAAVGCFLNMLPIRLRRSSWEGRDAAVVVRAARDAFLDAIDHGALPYDEIVAALPGAPGSRLHPLGNVMFVLVEEEGSGPFLGGVPAEEVTVHTGTARFDLTLSLIARGPAGGLEGALEYSLDVLDEAAARRMVERFLRLVRSVALDPEVVLDRLDLLDEDERQRLLVEFAGDSVDFGEPTTLHELVAATAARAPEAAALRSAGMVITHGELDRRSRAVAARLKACGVGPGARVGVTLPRSAEYVAVILGVLRTGAAWVPLDVGAAPARAEFIAADADLVAVVSEGSPGIRLPSTVTVVDVAGTCRTAGSADEAAPVVVDAAAPAYVMYTSGSTGKPKGVVVSHGSVVAFLRAMQRRFPLSADDVFLFSTGTTFDISVYEVFGPLTAGATIVVAPRGRPDPAEIAEIVGDAGVTVAQFVPSFLDLLVDNAPFAGSGRLRRVFCGGEAMSASLASRFLGRSGAELVNAYGPTEATVFATSWTCRRGQWPGQPPIGRPLDNVRVRLLDAALRPVPVGVAAELFLGGAQVAAGYLGRPDLTRERFIADPYGVAGDRLYRTGDICRWREDGDLEFLGRLDHQVKIRGHRIELGEIEAEIERLEPGARAVVLMREDRPGDVRLVAYVVGGPADDEATLRTRLAATLPEASLPARVVRLGAFPVTANGKLDRAAFPPPDPAQPGERSAASQADPPRGPTEVALAAIWSEVLGVESVGRDDRFFDVGGNSLLAMRFIAAVERAFGIRVPLRGFFIAPRLADLAALVTHLGAKTAAEPNPGEAHATPVNGGTVPGNMTLLETHESLVPLQPEGDRPPLFLFHGFGGGISHFLPLVERLDRRTPVYGLISSAFDATIPADASLAAIVNRDAEEIDRFVPEGPVNLGSLSLGGWIAYEVARVLRSRGRDVGTVILLDTYPNARLPVAGRLAIAWSSLVGRLEKLLAWVRSLCGGHVPRSVRRLLRLARIGPPESKASNPDNSHRRVMTKLVARHPTGRYDGRVDLVRSSNSGRNVIPHWKWLAGDRLRVHFFPVPHHKLVAEEHAADLGRLIQSILDDVETAGRDYRPKA